MNKIITIIAFSLTALLCSCKRETLMTYETDDNIYFNYKNFVPGSHTISYSDTAHIKFATRPSVVEDSVVLFVNLLGHMSAVDRQFTLVIDSDRSTAVAGTHYEMPADSSFYIPANAYQKRLRIKVFKPVSLKDKVVDLYLQLRPNDYFQTNLPLYNQTAEANTLHILIDDRLLEPAIWVASIAALGSYSKEKLELMVDLYGLDINRFYGGKLYTENELVSYARPMQRYLNSEKAAGRTIFEADGSEMKMGPTVQ